MVLLVVLAAVLWPWRASAAAATNTETRVGDFHLVVHAFVGAQSLRSAESHRAIERAAYDFASGYRLAAEAAPAFEEGAFSIINWKGYPAGMPRPTGPVNVLTGDAYAAARAAANETNAGIRAANGLEGSGLHIHEIQPVKFGGSPTDMANKMLLPAADHIGPNGVHPQFWTPLLRWATGGGG
ncbi:hypothetical protein BH09MYX1_BH09MYX1_62160 [soil metagenome]